MLRKPDMTRDGPMSDYNHVTIAGLIFIYCAVH